MTSDTAPLVESPAPSWALPGAMVWRVVIVAALAVLLSGSVTGWLLARASGQETVRRLVDQQNDEVEVFARLLSSKIEQSQKVLRSVAAGITPDMLDLPSTLEWLLQQGLPAVQFFDSVLVARSDGQMRVNLQNGRFEKVSNLEPAVRDALQQTLLDGKPRVAELVHGTAGDARIMLTMPLHGEDGTLLGVVAGVLKLQSQGLLPASMALPQRPDTRLMVFTRAGTILSHSNPGRVMGQAADEPGLAQVFSQWQANAIQVAGQGTTQIGPSHMVSVAGMPLSQWMVARVSDMQAVQAPLQGAQGRAWWLAAGAMAVLVLLLSLLVFWLALPLARLRVQAQRLLAAGAPSAVDWPRAGGEVGALVRVFEGLRHLQAQERRLLSTAQEQLQAVLDSASQGIVITRNARLEALSSHFCQMLGFQPGELQGKPPGTVCATRSGAQEWEAQVQKARAHQGLAGEELCLQRKDGSAVWVRVNARVVRADDPLSGVLWTTEELTASRQDLRHSGWSASHDRLTRLENRQGFEERLRQYVRSSQPLVQAPRASPGGPDHVDPGVVLFLDLDHFTVINDAVGHDAADDVLRHVARILESRLQGAGWVARLGGDEFAVLLPDCSEAYGYTVAEQLRRAVQDWEPTVQDRSFQLGVSIGLVVLDGGDHEESAILHAADMACYDAKRAGRNCVRRRTAQQAALPA